ncbi:NAD(P)/FAD-dependent oxidoreductase [Paraburkholderia sp. MMS20-SJTN17]|uniref:NAD(P)/FAD-dependent oxidoreductase n=1 Tax=Paraburkholderia translucens TaxID=2886945 RepID=A0ABS8K6Z2_9BURK|nr:NAD(P)/FAD-dependent oxidoreductase [Paraburkholderia sp. MMS20-SJTN17]MCC8400510.1 NAD(P)/FAD-dependent oxidoreductase [Paraburkholderia sp. MMS20-SJTN17]
MNRPRKVVIIGAGIAGLCAAVHARKCGYAVTVLEQHERPGGLATSWQRGGYTFEACLHWLLGSNPHDSMHALWREVFDIDRLHFVYPEEWMRIEGADGQHLSIYSDLERLEAELLRHAPQDEAQIRKFVHAVRSLSHCPLPSSSSAWQDRLTTGLQLLRRMPLLQSLSQVTSEDYGKRFDDPLLRGLFGEGENAQLAVIALVFALAWVGNRNAGYPTGGSRAVIGAIEQNLQRLGGVLRTGVSVERILVEDDTAVGVQLDDGERIDADWVVSAADGHTTIFDLLDGRYVGARIDHAYRTYKPFPSFLHVSLGVARDLSQKCGCMMHLLDKPLTVDPQTELRQIAFRLFHYDPTFAPAGKTAVTCVLPTRNVAYWSRLSEFDPQQYEAEKQRVANSVIAIFDERTPCERDAIEVIDVSTPATVVRCTRNWHGSMEGWLLTAQTGLRPLPSMLPGLRRFMMIGQWVMPGGGLPSGLITARRAVRRICREDGIAFVPDEQTQSPHTAGGLPA